MLMTGDRPLASDASNREIWEHACRLLIDCRVDEWADLFAVDAVMELPLVPPDVPLPAKLHGRDQIRRIMAPAQRAAFSRRRGRLEAQQFHQSVDPEVLIVEFDLLLTDPQSGVTVRAPYVHVMRIRTGEIALLRDYAPFHLLRPAA
jgi:uncharacterized protein